MTIGCLLSFAITLLVMHHFDRSQPAAATLAKAVANAAAAEGQGAHRVVRPVYPYSIVAGGVRSSEEVAQAMRRDPVVADHYANVRPENLHEERVQQPVLVHASYRIGDKVFWTARKLTLHPGEKILTDGKTTIRERCGNMLTVEPLAPALIDEPDAPEFDVPVTPWTPGAGYTLESPPVFFEPPDDPSDPPVDPPMLIPHSVEDPPLPIPEPSTWILVSLGLVIVVARSLARRRAGTS